jgi:2,3-diketo-5-methylthio-1-phosphopentane phosphatase
LAAEIDIKTYWNHQFLTLPEDLTKQVIKEYALTFEIDPYFIPFAKFCRDSNIDLTIISDGYIEYIAPIIEKNGLGDIRVKCNNMVYDSDAQRLMPQFPRASESCNCNSASCKRNAMLEELSANTISVYIGDGHSDFCPASHSDIIFAKKHLSAWCNENRIPHYNYSGFFDVLRILKIKIEKKDYKFRRQAELLRKKAFEIE